MGDVISIGDEVWTSDNEVSKVINMDRSIGMYLLDSGRVLHRYDFTPVKWAGDTLGNTGIGVCAQNGSEAAL